MARSREEKNVLAERVADFIRESDELDVSFNTNTIEKVTPAGSMWIEYEQGDIQLNLSATIKRKVEP